jgi:hypothetical protein
VVEIRGKSPYHENADEFVRRTTVTAPAGGEMSGLIAHFLFAAFLEWMHPEAFAELIENKELLRRERRRVGDRDRWQ